ncbi:MAG: hypothetical protein FWD19_03425, partial [Defluviitaleaceae bacterium]|nr:hypothetical protein [Defluviitaleaceae bacterium]
MNIDPHKMRDCDANSTQKNNPRRKNLILPHGTVRLPAFFPDGTRGVVRCVDSADLEACGVPGIVMNAYHLM